MRPVPEIPLAAFALRRAVALADKPALLDSASGRAPFEGDGSASMCSEAGGCAPSCVKMARAEGHAFPGVNCGSGTVVRQSSTDPVSWPNFSEIIATSA